MSNQEKPEVIRGITEFDEDRFVSTGRYPALGEEVEVVEILHSFQLAHLGERWPVFTRVISEELLEQRRQEYSDDPEQYRVNHLNNL
jgi:hypothetical protein